MSTVWHSVYYDEPHVGLNFIAQKYGWSEKSRHRIAWQLTKMPVDGRFGAYWEVNEDSGRFIIGRKKRIAQPDSVVSHFSHGRVAEPGQTRGINR